jgi:lysosomal acid phosphatase
LFIKAFEKHVKQFYSSSEFKDKEKEAEPFFKAVKDFVFGRPTTLKNIVSPSPSQTYI